MPKIGKYWVDKDRFYWPNDTAHTWAKVEDGKVRVGVDDFAQWIMGLYGRLGKTLEALLAPRAKAAKLHPKHNIALGIPDYWTPHPVWDAILEMAKRLGKF